MDTSLQMDTLTIQLPKTDLTFLKSLGKRLGWKIGGTKTHKKTAYQRSVEEAERGEVNEYSSTTEFYRKMGI